MSLDRYNLANVYNKAVTTRLQDKQLLNEVKLSGANTQKFIEKYGKKTVHVDLGPVPGKRDMSIFKEYYYKYFNLFKKYGVNPDIKSATTVSATEHWPEAIKKELPHSEQYMNLNRSDVEQLELDRDNPAHIKYIKTYCFDKAFRVYNQITNILHFHGKHDIKIPNFSKEPTNYEDYYNDPSDDDTIAGLKRNISKTIVQNTPFQSINLFPPLQQSFYERRNIKEGNYSKKETQVRQDLIMFMLQHEISFVNVQRPGITLQTTLANATRVTFPDIDFTVAKSDSGVRLGPLGFARTDSEITNAWHYWLLHPGERSLDMYKDDPDRTYIVKAPVPRAAAMIISQTQSGYNLLRDGDTIKSNEIDYLFTTAAPTMNTQLLLVRLLEQSVLFGFDEKFNIANTYLTRKVEQIRSNRGSYSGSWLLHDEKGNTTERERDITFFVADFDYWYILIFFMFNVKQQYLPIKDIFSYRTLNDLLRALLTSRSQRQQKKGFAVPADLNRCIIYRDNRVIVVKPDSWDVSHKYFGKYRTSIITGKTIEGSHWCTAASTNMHWNMYVKSRGNHMYYFMDVNTEELWAIRTIGKDWNNPIIASWDEDRHLFEHPEYQHMGRMVQVYREHNPKEMQNLSYDIKGLAEYMAKNHTFSHFAEVCTLETRNQANDYLDTPYKVFGKYNLNDAWIKQHITFIDEINNNIFK